MGISKKTILAGVAFVVAVLIVSAGLYLGKFSGHQQKAGQDTEGAGVTPARVQGEDALPKTVELNETQAKSVKVEQVGERTFVIQREAVGSIDFNQDMTVQVFSPYQGKIVGLFAKLGDEVAKGRNLYTIDSPDLGQAESSLIAAAAVLELPLRPWPRQKTL